MVQSQDVRYQVPDHDFPIASNHKLIPSFYLLLDGPANKGVKLPCFVRSQLFNSSSSESHSQDLMEMLEDVETKQFMVDTNGATKPVWFIIADGGPDKNPRHFKNVIQYGRLFQKLKIDYLLVRVHAPGDSKFNPVERAMSSFSKKLVGVVLPWNQFGNHLAPDRKTVLNQDLAMRNMEYAASLLEDYWTRDLFAGQNVLYRYKGQEEIVTVSQKTSKLILIT
jgi:hypothetical protein